jgi:bacterial/archaeal transporter family protein
MLWVYLVVLANFFSAGSNVADKILRTRYLRNSFALTACYGISVLVFALVMLPFVISEALPIEYAVAAFFSGTLVPLSTLLYFKAMSVEEASRIAPLNNFSSIFTLILAGIFLHEKLSLWSYVAFILILLGGILLSMRRSVVGIRISKAMAIMLATSFVGGAGLVIAKYALTSEFFAKALMLFFLGAGLAELSFFAFRNVRNDVITSFRVHRKEFLIFIAISNIAVGLSQLLFYTGLKLGPASLVSVMGALTGVFVLVIATFLSIRFPLFLKESLSPGTLSLKLGAIALMAVGLALLYI